MADKITQKVNYIKGTIGIDEWMQQYIIQQPSFNKGNFKLESMDLNGTVTEQPVNRVGILFEDCKFMREGSDLNHGSGGSNCVTGNPCYFVDISTVHPASFKGEQIGILTKCKKPCYVLPLAMLGDAPDLLSLMSDTYAGFIAQRRGDTMHDESHIVNGICCGLAAICYALCKEITLHGTIDTERICFLVKALYSLGLTAQSVYKYSVKCKKIFDLLPKMSRTADTFQSVLVSFIFDQKPPESICVNLLGASILRNSRHCKNESYITENPCGLIGLLLIAPMLSGIFSVSNLDIAGTVNQIVSSINYAITLIKEDLASHHGTETRTDEQNKLILRGFARASRVNFVSPDLIDKIYDAVIKNGTMDIASELGLVINPDFIITGAQITINNTVCKNYPVMIKNEESTNSNSKTYIPGDPREWTGLILRSGAKYKFEAEPLGLADFKSGNTAGDHYVANFRFTAGTELLQGLYPGYAASGMSYDPLTRRFTENRGPVDPMKSFEITATNNEILVTQNGIRIFSLSEKELHLKPLICFKYCLIKITLIERFEQIDHSLVVPGITYAEKVKKETNILSLMSITEQLKTLEIPEPRSHRIVKKHIKSRKINRKISNI